MNHAHPLRLALFLAGALLASDGPVRAGTATHNLAITATVATNCTLSAGTLAFGIYDPTTFNLTTPLDTTATLDVNCSYTTPATIALDQGLNRAGGSSASVPLR